MCLREEDRKEDKEGKKEVKKSNKNYDRDHQNTVLGQLLIRCSQCVSL